MDTLLPANSPEAFLVGSRSTEVVFCDHLELRRCGDVNTDIERNYASDVVLLTTYGVFEGHDGVRRCADLLGSHIGDAKVTIVTRRVHDDVAFLEWTAHSDSVLVEDGTDTFIIREGQIVTGTIHYTVKRIDVKQRRWPVVIVFPPGALLRLGAASQPNTAFAD